jgi:hypothetical protein
MKKVLFASVAAIGLSLASLSAQAVAINGGIAFGGDARPNTGDWDTATAVDFGAASPNAIVTLAVGDYAVLPAFATGALFSDFTFSPSLDPNPIVLWTVTVGATTYDFLMTSVSIFEQEPGADALLLRGMGLLRITGFDDTPGEWDFSAQQTGLNVFSFSASNASLPEPSTLALLGLGLLGISAARRRKI